MSETRVGCEFLVTKAELVSHFGKRLEHHEAKARIYAARLEGLRVSSREDVEPYLPDSLQSSFHRQNVVDTLEAKRRHHEYHAARFAFYAKHVACDMWLSRSEILDLEFFDTEC